ncbi:o-succinylbenzoate--CoA ligase [Salinicoccus albus]|uniref:o-succinylbenzoate--CoA ligase n=1 Tax=Salinicoccus albus TaxID=418756 RepID=UPI00035DDE13|nr:o-succinylbenzoate--CoA ligase [Salinicoccus albus]
MKTNWLQIQAETLPKKQAVIFEENSVTFSELHDQSLALAQKLTSLERGRVGLYADNHLNSVILIHACIQAGIECVMINLRLTGDEIDRQLNDVGVDTVLTTADFISDKYRVYTFEDMEQLESWEIINDTIGEDTLSIMFTSGTTGRAKAVRQSYNNHYESALGCEKRFSYNENSIWMNVNPVYHISGFSILMRSVIRGCTMVLNRKFDPEAVWNKINQYEVTHTSMVPVMLERMMKYDMDHKLEGILLGGAGVTMDILERALDWGLPVYNSFGMTETCSQIVSIGPRDPKILGGTVGRPLDNISLKIDHHQDGELLVKGPAVTEGYVNAELEKEDGFFRTGDIGYIDDDGYLYILDRRNDLIISGGENIYPKEIEDAVKSLDGISQAVVIKKKDKNWGEVPVLLFEPEEGANVDSGKIKSHLENRLARYKLPKETHETEKVFMTSTGKVSRAKNKEVYEAEKER